MRTARRLLVFLGSPRRLEKKPRATLAFVDPYLEQARGSHIIVLVAQTVYRSKGGDELLVIVTKLGEHVLGSHIVGVVVEDPLQAGDLADRAQRRTSYLSTAFRYRVSHRKELIALLVEQKVIVAKIRTAHVPVKILGLRIEREHIREQCREGCGDILCRSWAQVGGGIELRDVQC